jgi:hypothetical protein
MKAVSWKQRIWAAIPLLTVAQISNVYLLNGFNINLVFGVSVLLVLPAEMDNRVEAPNRGHKRRFLSISDGCR